MTVVSDRTDNRVDYQIDDAPQRVSLRHWRRTQLSPSTAPTRFFTALKVPGFVEPHLI